MKKYPADRTRLAVWLCAAMLLCCFLALAQYLAPALRTSETRGDAFGMVLIDIADEVTADSYHVSNYGVYVLAVQERSQADRAGIASGDLLLSANNWPVSSTGEFATQQERFIPGDAVELGFQRGTSGAAYAVKLVWNEE